MGEAVRIARDYCCGRDATAAVLLYYSYLGTARTAVAAAGGDRVPSAHQSKLRTSVILNGKVGPVPSRELERHLEARHPVS